MPHLVDRLAASLNADGVDSESYAMSLTDLTPAATFTSESHDEEEVPDVSRLWDWCAK